MSFIASKYQQNLFDFVLNDSGNAVVEAVVELNAIIEQAEKDLKELDKLFVNSGLPVSCDKDFVNDLLLQVRHL